MLSRRAEYGTSSHMAKNKSQISPWKLWSSLQSIFLYHEEACVSQRFLNKHYMTVPLNTCLNHIQLTPWVYTKSQQTVHMAIISSSHLQTRWSSFPNFTI